MALFSAALTAIYMFRLLFFTFYGKFRGTHEQEHHLHESPPTMTIPLIVLAILSVVGGFVNLPHFIGHGHYQYLAHWLQPVLVKPVEHAVLDFTVEMILLAVTIIMVAIIFFVVKGMYVGNLRVCCIYVVFFLTTA